MVCCPAYGVAVSESAHRQVLAEFVAWAEGNHPGVQVEPDVVETILEFKASYFDSTDPASWRAGEMTEILVDIVPRKVIADQEWTEALVRTVPLFVEFLADQKRPYAIRRLRAEAESAVSAFAAAVNDPERWGMGKRLLSAMGAEGIPDQATLDELTAEFNALPFEERDRILGAVPPAGPPPQPPVPLPAVRVAPVAELVDAARSAPLVADVLSLVRWLGDRREVTATGALRVKDGRQAALDLGLVDPAELARRELMWPLRSSADLRDLDELWSYAAGSGFVRLTASRAYPGEAMDAWQSGDGDAVLSAWGDLFDAVLAALVEGDMAAMTYQADVHADLPPMLFTAYADGEISRERVVESHAEQIAGHQVFTLPSFDPRTEVAEALDGGLSRLERLGAVTLVGDAVRLTPLGVWKLNTLYTSFGWDAPSVGDLSGADTITRLTGLSQLTDDDAEAELAAWLDAADHETLAGELANAISEADPHIRPVVFDLLNRIGPAARPAVARLIDTPWWRYAATWFELRGESGPRPMSDTDRAWMAAEQLAPMIDALGTETDELREAMPGEIAEANPAPFFDGLSRTDHPRAGDVLEAISRIVTDKAVSKAARKAAFKARSR
ncbi:hypothetical protein SAMN04488563_2153 [Jiangella alkaliphila]|uniref:Uncharacterized protein n=1 Tax=Jiangella alkaliphila TaxID=419479 RepID=A0A1H2IZ65_9ACTN|nr:hypothetical protein SAMN04488563_2153 [Jiangella alkaliphila]